MKTTDRFFVMPPLTLLSTLIGPTPHLEFGNLLADACPAIHTRASQPADLAELARLLEQVRHGNV